MPKVAKKSRAWVFTCNNYNEANVLAFDELKTVYRIRAFEVGESGTPHIQAYAYFKSQIARTALAKKLPGYWFQPAKGSAQENRTYCIKQGQFEENGKLPTQGARNDIHAFVLAMQATEEKSSERNLVEEHSSMVCKYPMFVDRCLRLYHPPKPLTELNNWWYYGPPGTGKTTAAASLGSHFVKFPNKWFDGYAGEDILIVEDIEPRHSFMSHSLKLWADKAPFTAQVKGSSTFIRPKMVVVTANYTIAEMGWDEVTTKAIQRRFTEKLFEHIF